MLNGTSQYLIVRPERPWLFKVTTWNTYEDSSTGDLLPETPKKVMLLSDWDIAESFGMDLDLIRILGNFWGCETRWNEYISAQRIINAPHHRHLALIKNGKL